MQNRRLLGSVQRRVGEPGAHQGLSEVGDRGRTDRTSLAAGARAARRGKCLAADDAPRTLYNRPKNRFVAGFIGSPAMNIVDVERVDGKLRLGTHDVELPADIAAAVANHADSDFALGVRPEHLRLTDDGVPGEVFVVEALGSESFLHIRVHHQDQETLLVVREDGQSDIDRGDKVTVAIDGPVHVFGGDGECLGD
jgi:multiple sugar transport system ATP-binding protein